MAAKLLHSLADDSADLPNQIGCMTGIFQMFDHHHALTGRRLAQSRLPAPPFPGDSNFTSGSSVMESFDAHLRYTAAEIKLKKTLNDKQRLSTESSRASLSSSCSSPSSLDFNRVSHPELSSLNQIIFPEIPPGDLLINHSYTPPHYGRQSPDLRQFGKESVHKDVTGHKSNQKDCLWSESLSKCLHESCQAGNIGKNQKVQADYMRSYGKLQEASHQVSPSYEEKNGSWSGISEDDPPFSDYERKMNHLSLESRDTMRSTLKFKELPRLSMDTSEVFLQNFHSDSELSCVTEDLQNCANSNEKVQLSRMQIRPPSVVAKLMGLETLPDSSTPASSYSQTSFVKTSPFELDDPYAKPSKKNDSNRPTHIIRIPKNLSREPSSPRWINPDMVIKPIFKFPIEPPPWKKQPDTIRCLPKPSVKPNKVSTEAAVDIERNLKDYTEFEKSEKDLRALKQILEEMRAKGILETNKEGQGWNFETQADDEPKCTSPSQNPSVVQNQRRQQINQLGSSTKRCSDASKTNKSPIVIMKPAKLVEKSSVPKIKDDGCAYGKKGFVSSLTAKDQKARAGLGNEKATQSSARSLQLPKESSVKSTGSASPKVRQSRYGSDKQSTTQPPPPLFDSNKPRRQSNRQPRERDAKNSPHKSRKMQQCDDQLSQISNKSRTTSYQDELKTDCEVLSTEQSLEINSCDSFSLEMPNSTLEEDGRSTGSTIVTPDHPSPISVLDASIYRDEELSPVTQTPNKSQGTSPGECTRQSKNICYDDNLLSNTIRELSLSSDVKHKKLENIENLEPKLHGMNWTHKESSIDYSASLCENMNPYHEYVSEILMASGILFEDLTAFWLHQWDQPINPELFFVLEQKRKSSHNFQLQRRLMFDTVNEILGEKLHGSTEIQLRKITKKTLVKDLFTEIDQLQFRKHECRSNKEQKGVLQHDLMHCYKSWREFHVEVSDVVLDVERMIFKDLVNEVRDIVINERGARAVRAKAM